MGYGYENTTIANSLGKTVTATDNNWTRVVAVKARGRDIVSLWLTNQASGADLTDLRLVLINDEGSEVFWLSGGEWSTQIGGKILSTSYASDAAAGEQPDTLAQGNDAVAEITIPGVDQVAIDFNGNGATVFAKLTTA